MNKYLYKFIKFIDIYDINYDTDTIKFIFDFYFNYVYQSHIKKHKIDIIETAYIIKLHSKKEYPIMYVFFKTLQDMKLLNNLVPKCPLFKNFKIFSKWYRLNSNNVDIRLILKYIINNKIKYYDCFLTDKIRSMLYNKSHNNSFISLDIQQYIETHNLTYNKLSINDKHTIHLYTHKNKPDYNYIATIIEFMENIALQYNQPIPPVTLFIIYTEQKKIIKNNTDVLCSDNINSGSTYPGKTITCWREEEFYKVLIHELFHYYKFDFNYMSPSYKRLQDYINVGTINGTDRLNEAYTEANAIILHTLYKSVLACTGYENIFIRFCYFFNIERNFTLFQVAKIIALFNGNNIYDLFNNITIKQKTSVRAYFIIKCLLLLNLNDFYDFIKTNLVVDDNRLMSYAKIINISKEFLLSKKDIVEIINNFINIFKYNKNEWIYITSRMTII